MVWGDEICATREMTGRAEREQEMMPKKEAHGAGMELNGLQLREFRRPILSSA